MLRNTGKLDLGQQTSKSFAVFDVEWFSKPGLAWNGKRVSSESQKHSKTSKSKNSKSKKHNWGDGGKTNVRE